MPQNIADPPQTYLIALGGNIPSQSGPPELTLKAALARLKAVGLPPRAVSRFYKTPCFPAGAGPDYVNAAAKLTSGLAPKALLAKLHALEAEFGRERHERWGQRSLDLDLLAGGAQILPDAATFAQWQALDSAAQRRSAPQDLILPHPRLAERAFVLVPLADIAPDWVHPVLRKSVTEMLSALPKAEKDAVTPL